MSKRKGRKAFIDKSQTTQAAAPQQPVEAFTFGDLTPVMDKRDILDYAECIGNGRWYDPSVSFHGLAKSLCSAVHHSSPLYVKRNILASTYIPHPVLSQQEFSKLALDYLVFGNAFAELRCNGLGEPWRLETSPAEYTAGQRKRAFTGFCMTGKSRTSLLPVASFTCWSRILIRSCMAYLNNSAR